MEITKLNYTLLPPGFQGEVRAMRAMQESLSRVIDVLGQQSAAAQGLNRVITNAEKLRNAPTHILYLLKDSTAKNGEGEVIGLLKVGHKHLYLFDERDQVREVEPLCVLDFYIAEGRQRSGYGRLLFDYMLHDMETNAHELAIDGPSPKLEQFLAKNYGVERLIRQSNNFAVAPQFFDTADHISNKSGSGRSTPAIPAAVGRFAAPKPVSAIANVIHGGASYYDETNNGRARGSDLYNLRHTRNIWRQTSLGSGDSSERDADSPAPLSEDERLPEPLPWAPPAHTDDSPLYWDSDNEGDHKKVKESSLQRPSTLRVEPPAAPAAFADVPAAGLPSGSSTPSLGADGGNRRDAQFTEKGYFDIKYYHNRLW